MALTSHGHHIPGSSILNEMPVKTRCGGPGRCKPCTEQSKVYLKGDDKLTSNLERYLENRKYNRGPYVPRLRLPDGSDRILGVTSCGQPLLPTKGTIMVVDGEVFVVTSIVWNYGEDLIDVFLEPKD